MKKALVLSGGGAKGSWQFGALTRILDLVTFDVVTGVSVGALNGGMLAMGKMKELNDVWGTMANDRVYTNNDPVDELRDIAFHGCAFLTKPLEALIEKYFRIADFKTDFRFGFFSLRTGQYYSAKVSDFEDDENLQRAILASASMPLVFPDVPNLRFQGNVLEQLEDGGVCHVSPFSEAIDALGSEPGVIVHLSCQSPFMWEDTQAGSNAITKLERLLAVMEFQMADSDRKRLEDMNDFNVQARAQGATLTKNGSPIMPFHLISVSPSAAMDSLNFEQSAVQPQIAMGYSDAAGAIAQLRTILFPSTIS